MLYLNIMSDKKMLGDNEKNTEDVKATRDKMIKKILKRQLKTVKSDVKLEFRDVRRICKNIDGNIFNKSKCCLWTGKVINNNNKEKGRYVNFYFNGKKRALHRLLYCNFIENLAPDEYLTFTCKNKGVCCNLKHFKKISKNNAVTESTSNDDDVVIERKQKKPNDKLVLKFE